MSVCVSQVFHMSDMKGTCYWGGLDDMCVTTTWHVCHKSVGLDDFLFLSLSVSRAHSLSLYRFLICSLALSLSPSPALSLSNSLSLSFSLSLSLSLLISPLSPFLFPSLSPTLSLLSCLSSYQTRMHLCAMTHPHEWVSEWVTPTVGDECACVMAHTGMRDGTHVDECHDTCTFMSEWVSDSDMW